VQFISSYPNTPMHIIYIKKKYSWCVWTNFARCRTKPATMDARRLLWCWGPQCVQSGMPQLETIGNLSDFGQTMQDPTFEAPLQLALRSHYPLFFFQVDVSNTRVKQWRAQRKSCWNCLLATAQQLIQIDQILRSQNISCT